MGTLYYLVKMTFLTKFAYIKAFWVNIAGTLSSIVIYYFLWQFVFSRQETLSGFTAAEMTTYVILSRLLASQFNNGINWELMEWIKEGAISMELLRPIHLFFNLFGKRVGEFFFFILFKAVPVALICFPLLGGTAPGGAIYFGMFLLSVCLSVGIMFFLEMIVGLATFYVLSAWGLGLAKGAVFSILSGGVVPFFLFPAGIARVLELLPFAGMVSVPVNIYLGKYSLTAGWQYIGLQIVWIALMWALAYAFYRRSIRQVVIQGG